MADAVRLATWNVNSLNARMPRVEEWLDYAQPDVICLQETKMADGAFPAMAFAARGYEAAHHGDGRWNGVAVLSRIGLSEVVTRFEGDDPSAPAECRLVEARCGALKVLSVYVPNGRSVGSDHYQAKLAWLQNLRSHLAATAVSSEALAVCGDFNVAPDDRDVWDPASFQGATHVSEAERGALGDLMGWGLVDAFRRCYDQERLFSWWDYRAGDFHKGRGMRIDLLLVTPSVADHVRFALIDRFARKGRQPSDHAPVLVDLDIPY